MSLRILRAAGGICGWCYNRHVLLDLSSSPAEIPPLAQYLCETLGKVAIAAEEFQGCIVCMQTTSTHAHMEGSHSQGFWLSLACLEDSNLNRSFRSSSLLA